MTTKARPLIIVPQGLKEWFMRNACPDGVTLFAEVREVDPTLPGLPEFEDAISADFELENEFDPPEPPRSKLRLVTLRGQKLEP